MKSSKDIARTLFPGGFPVESGGLLMRAGYFLGSFVVSAAIIAGFVYLLSLRLTGSQPDLAVFYQFDVLVSLGILCLAASVGVGAITDKLVGGLFQQRPGGEAVPPPEGQMDHDAGVTTHQVLHLKRGAERLNHVEQDLVRHLSEERQVDTTTHHLLTEMCVCTNRLIGQLSDLNTDTTQLASRTALYTRQNKILSDS